MSDEDRLATLVSDVRRYIGDAHGLLSDTEIKALLEREGYQQRMPTEREYNLVARASRRARELLELPGAR
jgi:hypothetical protein